MRIATWNCNGALRKKLAEVDQLQADVLVIQECEDPSRSSSEYRNWAGDYLWVGDSKNKGIGIFPRQRTSVEQLEWQGLYRLASLSGDSPALQWRTDDLRLFLPCMVNNHFLLLAVWTKGINGDAFGYIGQFWKYLQIHREELRAPNTILLGDFNSNAIWDRPGRWWNHTDVVSELHSLGFQSEYHRRYQEEQGEETKPTFFLHRNANKPYHIDYVFTSRNLKGACSLEVGEYDQWNSVSDHVPLVLSIGRPGRGRPTSATRASGEF